MPAKPALQVGSHVRAIVETADELVDEDIWLELIDPAPPAPDYYGLIPVAVKGKRVYREGDSITVVTAIQPQADGTYVYCRPRTNDEHPRK